MIAARSLVVRDGIRLVSPFAVVIGVMLFFAGHNEPGGGFAAGLVFSAIIGLRSIVGLRVPTDPVLMMSIGGLIAVAVALAPMVAGEPLLDQVTVETTLPLLGKVKAGTSLIFDLGVCLVVVGLMVALLTGLSAAPPVDDVAADGTATGDGADGAVAADGVRGGGAVAPDGVAPEAR